LICSDLIETKEDYQGHGILSVIPIVFHLSKRRGGNLSNGYLDHYELIEDDDDTEPYYQIKKEISL
jgi:hypothetical protein